jgi:hypothetical protein
MRDVADANIAGVEIRCASARYSVKGAAFRTQKFDALPFRSFRIEKSIIGS